MSEFNLPSRFYIWGLNLIICPTGGYLFVSNCHVTKMIHCIWVSTAGRPFMAGLCGTCLHVRLVNFPYESTLLCMAKCMGMSWCIEVHLVNMKINAQMATRVVFRTGRLGFCVGLQLKLKLSFKFKKSDS